jgi:hypothetical protein
VPGSSFRLEHEMKTPPELALRRRIDQRARSLVDQAADC